MVLVFSIGYAGIIFEESLAFNKSGVGLLMAVCLWVIRSIGVRLLYKMWCFFSIFLLVDYMHQKSASFNTLSVMQIN